jgi:hypothetical protein
LIGCLAKESARCTQLLCSISLQFGHHFGAISSILATPGVQQRKGPFLSRQRQSLVPFFFLCLPSRPVPCLPSRPVSLSFFRSSRPQLTADSWVVPGPSIPSRAGTRQPSWYIVPTGTGYILVYLPPRGVLRIVPCGSHVPNLWPPGPLPPARGLAGPCQARKPGKIR